MSDRKVWFSVAATIVVAGLVALSGYLVGFGSGYQAGTDAVGVSIRFGYTPTR